MLREDWLNGLKRESDRVMVFPSIRCVGCGTPIDIVCYVPGDEYLTTEPKWPFEVAGCPLCYLRDRVNALPPTPRDKLLDRMNALRKNEAEKI